MIVGVVKEMKPDEYRVGLTPVGAELLRAAGHQVLIETQAGLGSGLTDNEYADQGAEIVSAAAEVWRRAEMIVKVKEPQAAELPLLRPGQVVFTYWHFAADEALTRSILASGVVAIAYETIVNHRGELPLLTPMSEVAGKMSIQEGAKYLERPMLGRGILLGGVPGVEPANVVVVGGGIVGTNAAKVAAGLGARLTIMDVSIHRLRYLDDIMPANVHTIYSDVHTIRRYVSEADLVIGAVLIPGARCPVLVGESLVAQMKPGAVIVDVGIDQGGCVETSRPTTHQDPTFVVHDVVHYGVTNMPGAVGRTSTFALTNATLPYVLRLAEKGYRRAAEEDTGFGQGCNIENGRVTNRAVADTFGFECHPIGG